MIDGHIFQHINTLVNDKTGIAKAEEAPRYIETSLSHVMCPRKMEDGPGARAHNGRPYLSKGRNDVNFFITVTVVVQRVQVQIPKRTA